MNQYSIKNALMECYNRQDSGYQRSLCYFLSGIIFKKTYFTRFMYKQMYEMYEKIDNNMSP